MDQALLAVPDRLPGDFFNDNATQTDSALSIIPKGSSAITISDNIYLSGAQLF